MDHKRLGRAVSKLDGQVEDMARRKTREDHREARFEKRRAPFQGLQTRNQAVYDKASAIAETGKDARRVCVVIGDTPSAPGNLLIAQITCRQEAYGYEEGDEKCVEFEFFKVKRPSFVREVGNNPHGYHLRAEMAVETEKLRGLDERTFWTGEESGEISRRAYHSISRSLMGSSGASEYRRMSNQLTDVELSISMIDEAARNPELNPVLAAKLELGPLEPVTP